MGDPRQTLGRAAEEAAARFLEQRGIRVVERNVRIGRGEIDLVCRDAGVWVFVEVKSRQARWGDAPSAAVSLDKQRRLARLAEGYLKWRRLREPRCRFDVVAVTVDGQRLIDIRHIRSAFDAPSS